MNYTPGEWWALPFYYGCFSVMSEAGEICRVFPPKDGTAEAHSHLIVAAPEMYKLLERLIRVEGEADELSKAGMVDDAHIKALRAMCKQARALLAKVEGKGGKP